jgi:hypothetical protein
MRRKRNGLKARTRQDHIVDGINGNLQEDLAVVLEHLA